MNKVNPSLLALATEEVWKQGCMEKSAIVPPPGMDPAAGGMPPGGAPPMDPAMAGGMPPGGAPPMDPAMGGMAPPPMDPAMAGGMPPGGMPLPADPMAAGGAAGGQKMKPEQMMQMLDFRLYNMQQQFTALMNHVGVEIPPGALIMPPGQMSPTPESALPGGPQDPTQQQQPGGGAGSAIGGIDPIQGASPELAGGMGGGMGGEPKMASHNIIADPSALPNSFMRKAELSEFVKDANAQAPVGYQVALIKVGEGGKANISSTSGDVDEEGPSVSPPNKALNVKGSPATTPSLNPPNNTAGGSKDPLSVTDGPMPAPKTASQQFGADMANSLLPQTGTTVDLDLAQDKSAGLWHDGEQKTSTKAAALVGLLKSRANASQST